MVTKLEEKIEELENMKKEHCIRLESETDYEKLNDILIILIDIDNKISDLMEEWVKFYQK